MSRNRWAQQRCLGPYQPAFFEGDVVQITLVPDQPLTIPTYAGPSLKIRFLDRYSDYSNFEGLRTVSFQPSKSSNQALVFEYTVKKGDADFDGYQIESTSLDGITGITATGNGKQLLPLIFTENPIFALDENGRQDTDPDAVKLPPVDAVGVVQVDHSLRDCPSRSRKGTRSRAFSPTYRLPPLILTSEFFPTQNSGTEHLVLHPMTNTSGRNWNRSPTTLRVA